MATLPPKERCIMSENRKSWTNRTHLMLESLEARSLLSGIHTALSAHEVDHHHAAIVSMQGTSSAKTTAEATGQQSETHLVATLADPANASGVTGTAKFESETEHGLVVSELSVQVKGATPGAVIDVTISGSTTPIGQITVKADGTGQLKLTANVPAVATDSVISLSTTSAGNTTPTLLASGSFVTPTGKPNGSHDHGNEGSETHLVASLADPNSKLTGSARYESETEHGLVANELSVQIKGGTPGAIIDVSLAADSTGPSTSIGKITVGADGTGRLKLNSNVPAITTTSIITLSATAADGSPTTAITSATFAIPTPTTKKAGH